MDAEQIGVVRAFHRLVTQRSGSLEAEFLGRARPLGESRVLFEIGAAGAELRDLRSRLRLDSGYMSRLVSSLEAAGLVRVEATPGDERVRRAELTDAGREELAEIDGRAEALAASLLEPLSPGQRSRLAEGMADVTRLLRLSGLEIQRVDPSSWEARRCVERYFEELAERFPSGFDAGRSLPAAASEMTAPRGTFLVGMVDGEPVAGGGIKGLEPGVGSIKRMWVDPSMRGLGVGRRMLERIEEEAGELGMTTLRLETNGVLKEAIGLYRSSGYAEVEAFNEERYAEHWFEKRLK